MDDLNLYDDLDEFQEQQEKKSKELQDLEIKYQESLKTIEALQSENVSLKKSIKNIEVNFQNLLDTARAEINRKNKQIDELRKEKDDICFRRRLPPTAAKEIHIQDQSVDERLPEQTSKPFEGKETKYSASEKKEQFKRSRSQDRGEHSNEHKRLKHTRNDQNNKNKQHQQTQRHNDFYNKSSSRHDSERHHSREHRNYENTERYKKTDNTYSSKSQNDDYRHLNRNRDREEYKKHEAPERNKSPNRHKRHYDRDHSRERQSFKSKEHNEDKEYSKTTSKTSPHKSVNGGHNHDKRINDDTTKNHKEIVSVLGKEELNDLTKNERHGNEASTKNLVSVTLKDADNLKRSNKDIEKKYKEKNLNEDCLKTMNYDSNVINKNQIAEDLNENVDNLKQLDTEPLKVPSVKQNTDDTTQAKSLIETEQENTEQKLIIGVDVKKICTPRKLALLKEIFGESPSSTSSTISPSNNTPNLLEHNSTSIEIISSATTSPSNYTDATNCSSAPKIVNSNINSERKVPSNIESEEKKKEYKMMDNCFIRNDNFKSDKTIGSVDLTKVIVDDIANEIQYLQIPGLDLCSDNNTKNACLSVTIENQFDQKLTDLMKSRSLTFQELNGEINESNVCQQKNNKNISHYLTGNEKKIQENKSDTFTNSNNGNVYTNKIIQSTESFEFTENISTAGKAFNQNMKLNFNHRTPDLSKEIGKDNVVQRISNFEQDDSTFIESSFVDNLSIKSNIKTNNSKENTEISVEMPQCMDSKESEKERENNKIFETNILNDQNDTFKIIKNVSEGKDKNQLQEALHCDTIINKITKFLNNLDDGKDLGNIKNKKIKQTTEQCSLDQQNACEEILESTEVLKIKKITENVQLLEQMPLEVEQVAKEVLHEKEITKNVIFHNLSNLQENVSGKPINDPFNETPTMDTSIVTKIKSTENVSATTAGCKTNCQANEDKKDSEINKNTGNIENESFKNIEDNTETQSLTDFINQTVIKSDQTEKITSEDTKELVNESQNISHIGPAKDLKDTEDNQLKTCFVPAINKDLIDLTESQESLNYKQTSLTETELNPCLTTDKTSEKNIKDFLTETNSNEIQTINLDSLDEFEQNQGNNAQKKLVNEMQETDLNDKIDSQSMKLSNIEKKSIRNSEQSKDELENVSLTHPKPRSYSKSKRHENSLMEETFSASEENPKPLNSNLEIRETSVKDKIEDFNIKNDNQKTLNSATDDNKNQTNNLMQFCEKDNNAIQIQNNTNKLSNKNIILNTLMCKKEGHSLLGTQEELKDVNINATLLQQKPKGEDDNDNVRASKQLEIKTPLTKPMENKDLFMTFNQEVISPLNTNNKTKSLLLGENSNKAETRREENIEMANNNSNIHVSSNVHINGEDKRTEYKNLTPKKHQQELNGTGKITETTSFQNTVTPQTGTYNANPISLPSISTTSPTPSNFSGIFSKQSSLSSTTEDDFHKCKKKSLHFTTRPREYILPAASVLCNMDNLENATKLNKKLHWELLENKHELTEIEDDTDIDTTDEEHKKCKVTRRQEQTVTKSNYVECQDKQSNETFKHDGSVLAKGGIKYKFNNMPIKEQKTMKRKYKIAKNIKTKIRTNRLTRMDSLTEHSIIAQQPYLVAFPKRQRGRPRKLENLIKATMLNKKTKTLILANKQVLKKRGRKPKRPIEPNKNRNNNDDQKCAELNTQLITHDENNEADTEIVERNCILNSDQNLGHSNSNCVQEIHQNDIQPNVPNAEINYNASSINDIKDTLNDKDNPPKSLLLLNCPDIPTCFPEQQNLESKMMIETNTDKNKDKKSVEIFTNEHSSPLNYDKQNCCRSDKNSSEAESSAKEFAQSEKVLYTELISEHINVESHKVIVPTDNDEVSTTSAGSDEKLEIVSDGGQETSEKHTQDAQEETAATLNPLEQPITTKKAVAKNNIKKYISLEEIGIKVRPFKGHLSTFRIPKLNQGKEHGSSNSWKLENYTEPAKEKPEQNVTAVKQEVEKGNIDEILTNCSKQKSSLSSYRIPKIKKDVDDRKDSCKDSEIIERKLKNATKNLGTKQDKTANKSSNHNNTKNEFKKQENENDSFKPSNTVCKDNSENSKLQNRMILKEQKINTVKRKLCSPDMFNQHDSDNNKSQTDIFIENRVNNPEILCEKSKSPNMKSIKPCRRKSLAQKILDSSSDEEDIGNVRTLNQSVPIKTQRKPINIHRKILDSSSDEDKGEHKDSFSPEVAVAVKAGKSFKEHRKSTFDDTVDECNKKHENPLKTRNVESSAASVKNNKNTELMNLPNKISESIKTRRKSILIDIDSSNAMNETETSDLKTLNSNDHRKNKLEGITMGNDMNNLAENIIEKKPTEIQRKSKSEVAEEMPLKNIKTRSYTIDMELETSIEFNKKLKTDCMNSSGNMSTNKGDNKTIVLEHDNKTEIADDLHSSQNSIVDSCSEDNEQPMKKSCVVAAVPEIKSPLKDKKPRSRKKRVVKILSTSMDALNNSRNSSLQSDTLKQPSPFASPLLNHPIFNADVSTPSYEFGSSGLIQLDDKKFNEIDSKLHEIFQSPQYTADYKTQQNSSIDSTNLSILATTANDNECKNVAIEETSNKTEDNIESSANKTKLNESFSDLNKTTTTALNCSEIKHLSLGSAEYRFEKVSDNVVNLFISRKRKRKRNT